MKLSFVIPAYNEEAYLGKCLDSVFQALQAGQYDAEVIVVDNNSTDQTAAVARRYVGVKLVEETKRGLVWARRAGFMAANGELIANIDADTMLTPGWIDKVLKEFRQNKKLVALSGPHIHYDLSRGLAFWTKFFYGFTYFGYLVNRFVFNVGSMVQGGNFVIRRAALEKINGYNTDIDFYGEDADLARRLHPLGDVKFTFSLPIYASGRRMANEGIWTMGIRYGANYLSTIFLKRPVDKTALVVRPLPVNGQLIYRPINRAREWLISGIVIAILIAILAGAGYLTLGLIGTSTASAKLSYFGLRTKQFTTRLDNWFDQFGHRQ